MSELYKVHTVHSSETETETVICHLIFDDSEYRDTTVAKRSALTAVIAFAALTTATALTSEWFDRTMCCS